MAIRFCSAVAALGLSALPAGFACDLPHPHPAPMASSKVLSPVWVGPAFSGTWFAPERSGEGISLQILDNGTALALWFTYPPPGAPGQQAWIYAQDGRIEGDRVIFDGAFTTRGPRFGAAYDPASLQLIPWGTLELRFGDCNTADLTYAGPSAWGSGSRRLTRLTTYAELECDGKKRLTGTNTRMLSGLKQRTALWYDPVHNGEGWVNEELPDGRTQLFWYTYDANGDQAWMVGVSPETGNALLISEMYRPVGARFGAAFDPNAVQRAAWGEVTLAYAGCSSGTLAYGSTQAGFGSGHYAPIRLTKLAGSVCLDSVQAAPASGTWSSGPRMPTAQSESASSPLPGIQYTYVGGGFGDARAFYRFDALNSIWLTLARIPGARDHALMVAFSNEVLYTGGYSQGDGDQVNSGWRYFPLQDRWEAAPELPFVAASSAAQLGGFAYFGTLSGDLYQYNPRTRVSRAIASPRNVARDHSQLVAFQGELWMIGGRGGNPFAETRRTAIYDPASETWREGPAMITARAGFAAAVNDSLLIVAGGEMLSSLPYHTLRGMEAITAGASSWTALPDLPEGRHGVPGAILGNAFYLMGGSPVAGQATNTNDVFVYRW